MRPFPLKVTTSRLRNLGRSTTDALRLDTPERPYRVQSRLVSSRRTDARPHVAVYGRTLVSSGRASVPVKGCNVQATKSRSFDNGRPPPRRPVGTHGLCVRCIKSYSVMVLTGTDAHPPTSSCRDARSVRPLRQRLQRRGINEDGRPPPLRPVGTHGLCVRCVKGYSVVVLTRTDALPHFVL